MGHVFHLSLKLVLHKHFLRKVKNILAAMTVVISLWMSHTSAVPLNGADIAENFLSLNTTSRNSNSSLQNSTAANSTATCNATIANCMTQISTVQGNGTVVHVQVNLTNICESNRRKSLFVCNGTALNLTKHCEVAKTGNLPLVCRNGSVINSSSIATSNKIILEIAQSKVQFLRLTLQQRRHQFIL